MTDSRAPAPLDLEPIKVREANATKGPWFRFLSVETLPGHQTIQCAAGWLFVESDKGNYPDAEFIAHARADIPALLAEIESLRAECTRLRDARGGQNWRKVIEARLVQLEDDIVGDRHSCETMAHRVRQAKTDILAALPAAPQERT